MAIDWNAIYAEELNRIPDTSDQLRGLQQQDIAALDTQRTAQESTLRQQLSDAMRQAYITREMNRRDLPAIMSNMGLTGGITETASNDLLRDYRNTRNTANRSFTDSQTSLANTYNTNLAALNSDYGQRIVDALAQRRNEATSNANLRYQIAEAERQYQLQQEQWKWQQQQAAAAAGGGGGIVSTANSSGVNAQKLKDLQSQQYQQVAPTGSWGGSGEIAGYKPKAQGTLVGQPSNVYKSSQPYTAKLNPTGASASVNLKTGQQQKWYTYR